jgi:hypothetical protein
MPAPRPRPRSRPQPAAIEAPGRFAGWWERARGLVAVPPPRRLATLGGLAALTVALLVVLVERTKGGFDRTGLRQLASETTNPAPPVRPGYIKR